MLDKNIYTNIKNILLQAKNQIVKSVNSTMVYTYFEIGKIIVEHEQGGNKKAVYGEETLKSLSLELTREFGKGFSVQNLERMRIFYIVYGKSQTLSDQSQKVSKSQTLSAHSLKSSTLSRKFELSWSHYLILMRLEANERNFYEKEAILNNWSIRELQRQFDSALYERVVLSTDKKDTLVEITLPENSNIFASKYALYLPTKEELKNEIENLNN